VLNRRCAFSLDWPVRLTALRPNALFVRLELIAAFTRVGLSGGSALRASPHARRGHSRLSVEARHHAADAISQGPRNSQTRLMPASNESRELYKGFGTPKGGLRQQAHRDSLKCSELGSSRYGPADARLYVCRLRSQQERNSPVRRRRYAPANQRTWFLIASATP
jgi:hypothetical protein